MAAQPASMSTAEGDALFARSPLLTKAVADFLSSSKPEDVIGGVQIGNGSYSTTRLIDGVLVKVSSPTTNKKTSPKQIGRHEDLFDQFAFLSALHNYSQQYATSITAPKQYFVYRSPHGHLLCQQFMRGWVTISEWADNNYDANNTDDLVFVKGLCDYIRWRIADFANKAGFGQWLNDLKLDTDAIHSGNILVPVNCQPSPDMSLCIIDQPGFLASS